MGNLSEQNMRVFSVKCQAVYTAIEAAGALRLENEILQA